MAPLNETHQQANVWGVTVCNQEEADAKIPRLLQVPAKVRFVSIGPMLGPVTLQDAYPDTYCYCSHCGHHGEWPGTQECMECDSEISNDRGDCSKCGGEMDYKCPECGQVGEKDCFGDYGPVCSYIKTYLPGIHWVIIDAESGHQRRPANMEWIEDVIEQCQEAGTPCWT